MPSFHHATEMPSLLLSMVFLCVNFDLISIVINVKHRGKRNSEVIFLSGFVFFGRWLSKWELRKKQSIFSSPFYKRHNFLEFSMNEEIHLFALFWLIKHLCFYYYAETKRRYKNCVQEAFGYHEIVKSEVSSTCDQ